MINSTNQDFPLPPHQSHSSSGLVVLFGVMASVAFVIVVVATVCYCLDHREQARPRVEQ
ncbi:hypothetical protein AtNW77_Chr3g0189511 [Arabidopsis thaliana]|uniref:Transmembrane protein n=4 Tax=Arabidopsis TaxID=3701 RepID=A0A384L156_ARATH|nr:uncharacterized protein AT3G28674 [Arabidopsis thaliana]AEE77473.1 transmembrane protein [Arabidopsis thaliana]KAG7626935.1 hypothetical protein ISN45_At03g030570 [Arabidopsis thaliana x Arabidopsis arenosa]OAP02362.1 hypothetical protein AXX17_AT3G31330 [Arabidopsis thaliana]|eukprot:NP_001118732.1 transmembrane protein [Arabidopsis thaliana]